MEKIESYRFDVEAFHVDFTGHLFAGVLCNHLLNAAGRHSSRRGWGIDALNRNAHTWVLSRLCLELAEMPGQYEHVVVETWVESVMKLFTERDFRISNADDGRIYGYARSVWAMIDTTTRRPADLLAVNDGDIARYVVAPEEMPCPIARHRRMRVTSGQPAMRLKALYCDADINGHVNSMKYLEHILDLFGREQWEQHRLRRIELAYKAECHIGDTLEIFADDASVLPDGSPETVNAEIRRDDGTVAVAATIVWA